MYRVQKKRRGGGMILLLFLCALAIGVGIGYGGVMLNLWGGEASPAPEAIAPKETVSPANTTEPNRPANADPVPQETEKPETVTYFVAEEGGDVCVFTVDSEGVRRFSHKIPVELSDLPDVDKQLFKKGISVATKEELASLMEDFSS